MLTSYVRIDPLGWTIFVEQPVSEAFAPLYASILRTGVVLLAALLLSLLASLVLARRMVRPINALREGAAGIAAGKLDQRIEVRTGDELEALATRLQDHPRFADYLTPAQIEILYKSAPLHDIGKVGIPDRILLKPGRFEPGEFEIMKTHCALGRDAILAAERLLDAPNSFLRCAREIAHYHQEKWNGSGYPEGLKGDAIPASARLMAVADVYDALISKRVYKEGMPHAKAVAIIRESRGAHFDPDMVDAFVEIQEEFGAIAGRYADSDKDMQQKTAYLAGAMPATS